MCVYVCTCVHVRVSVDLSAWASSLANGGFAALAAPIDEREIRLRDWKTPLARYFRQLVKSLGLTSFWDQLEIGEDVECAISDVSIMMVIKDEKFSQVLTAEGPSLDGPHRLQLFEFLVSVGLLLRYRTEKFLDGLPDLAIFNVRVGMIKATIGEPLCSRCGDGRGFQIFFLVCLDLLPRAEGIEQCFLLIIHFLQKGWLEQGVLQQRNDSAKIC